MHVCPNCGNFVKVLIANTGWCRSCTQLSKRESWLERNATLLESWIKQGYTFRQAVVIVIERNRPTCLNCGSPIKHGTNGRHVICTKTVECRKARRKYKYLVYERGINKDIALRVALGLREAA